MDDIEVYDYVLANTLEDGDQVALTNDEGGTDYLENVKVTIESDAVSIRGFSEITGDEEYYIVTWDTEVGLWTV